MEKLRELLRDCICDIEEAAEILNIPPEETADLIPVSEKYPICIPPYYLNLIDPNDPDDPIRKMSIPGLLEISADGEADTSNEAGNTVMTGVQHKYAQTMLILSTNQCAMYCRHCFRKRLVGSNADEIAKSLPEMADYARNHPEINNVLISGGDSFINSNANIENFLRTFAQIDSLKYIRFGTRTPVVLPERIYGDDELLSILKHWGAYKQIVVVTQFNHPNELTEESEKAVRALLESGIPVRNQTVLLKGINDDPDVLSELMNGLLAIGVMPYYIFQCRPVRGVLGTFQVPIRTGTAIIDEARKKMNGPAKAFRYAMSHPSGKIEILGSADDGMTLFKYHQAKKENNANKLLMRMLTEDDCWLE